MNEKKNIRGMSEEQKSIGVKEGEPMRVGMGASECEERKKEKSVAMDMTNNAS